MKKFNGTDYDNLLPLAYNALNSQQLDGKTFNEIQDIFTSTDLYLYTSNYIGTGTYGENNFTVLTFPFEPVIIFMPSFTTDSNRGWDVIQALMVKESWSVIYNTFNSGLCFIKCSTDRKTFSLLSAQSSHYQYNIGGQTYYYAAIGGYDRGQSLSEWIITQSGTWTVPKTGKYYLELYGGGGYGALVNDFWSHTYLGGSSCQSYEAITLNKGQAISVVIGRQGNYKGNVSPTGTQFGSYSVAAGGNATPYNGGKGGAGSGNKGTTIEGDSVNEKNYSNGKFNMVYGYGSNDKISSGPGAVYLKYLGA